MNKYLVLLAVVVLICEARLMKEHPPQREVKQVQYWFNEQLLDHSDPTNTQTWSQRYWVIDTFFKQNEHPHPEDSHKRNQNAVILYICGEYTCPGIPESRHFPLYLAKRYNALVLVLEHRYYGQSMPFGEESLKVENMKHLSISQALDDIAHFMLWAKYNLLKDHHFHLPWVTIGGSYPGALSAWFRYKYPHLTVGALASSAVVNSIVDFPQFDQQIRKSTLKSGPQCTESIQRLTAMAEQHLAKEELSLKFKSRFGADQLNEGEFLFYFADIFVEMVQYGKRTYLCEMLEGKSTEEQMDAVVNYVEENNVTPFEYGSHYLRNDSYDPERAGSRQWAYQSCTEVGWFQTADPLKVSLRSQKLTADFYKQWCKDAFGKDLWPNQWRTNNYWGGLGLNVDRLIMTNGSEDPWQHASKLDSGRSEVYADVIDCENCAHCVELYTPCQNDSEELKQARREIIGLFDQWIQGGKREIDDL